MFSLQKEKKICRRNASFIIKYKQVLVVVFLVVFFCSFFLLMLFFVVVVALRPKSTAMIMAGQSVHLTTLFSWASLNKQLSCTSCTYFRL